MIGRVRSGLGLAKLASGERSPRDKYNVIYRACGFTILLCVVLAALSNLLPASVKADVPLLFIFEALAVFAFGISWSVKGRTLQGILGHIHSRPQ
jgi:hypothetical protein